MKRIKLAFLSAAVLLTTACHFELPQKISVKSNAEYNFGIGKINQDIGEYVKVNELIKSDALESINGKVYDYFPNEADANTQSFLIKIPFIEVPIDIGKYYDESDLSAAIQDVSFEKEITIPDVSFSQDIEIGDLSAVSDVLNALVVFGGSVDGADSFDVTLQFPEGCNFDSIIYNNCTFEIDNLINISSGTRITISSKGKSFFGIVSGTSATIAITESFEITKNSMKVTFDRVISSGGFKGRITSGDINTIKGLTLPDPLPSPLTLNINPVQANIDIPTGTFESCEIGEGNLTVKAKMPATWRGVSLTKDIDASGTALTVPASSLDTISLAGETLKPGSTTVTVSNIKFDFNNATIKFSDKPKISAGVKIAKFNKIALDASGINTELTKSDAFPESVYSTVEKIVLAPSGIKGTYINTFPAGNDININVDSKFFDISSGSATLSASTAVKTPFADILCADNREVKFANANNLGVTPQEFNEWDINLKIDLPGSTPGKIEISGVKPNETYKIGVTVTPVLDWKSVDINADAFSTSPIQGRQSLGFNIASLLKDAESQLKINGFASSIGFVNLPIYIRAEKPAVANNLLDDFNFTGKVKLYQSADSGNTSVFLAGNPVEIDVVDGSIGLVDALPNLKMKGDTLVTNVASYPSSVSADLADFFNQVLKVPDTPTSELYVKYDVTMGASKSSIPINKEDISGGNTVSALSAYALIEIPLKLKIQASDIEVNILDLAKLNDPSSDLFNRDSASSFDEINEYLDLIESCSITYNPTKLPLVATLDPEVKIQLFSGSREKVLTTRGGTLSISRNEVQDMLNSYPYNIHSAKAVLPANSVISIPRNLEFSADLSVNLVTNGEIEIFGGKN